MLSTVHPTCSHIDAPESPRQLLAFTDDLLEEIFIRIPCPADLTRASAACAAFRRLITDGIFLRRYRSRHPPLLLGFLNVDVDKGFQAVEAPHPNAPAARAMANVSFDFLPPPSPKECWYISDVRDGRVLFGCFEHVDDGNAVVVNLAVCDPSSLSRRYLLLPPVPHDNLQAGDQRDLNYFDGVFAPCAQEDEAFFRVMGVVYYKTKLVVLDFDSASGSWTVRTSASLDTLTEFPRPFLMPTGSAYGCVYWKINDQSKLIKLDINRMQFSTLDLPPGHEEHDVVLVEAGEDGIGMLSYSTAGDGKTLNCYKSTQDQGTYKWQMRNSILLPDHDDLQIVGAPPGYVFIQGDLKVRDTKHTTIYSLDIKTLKFGMVTRVSCHFRGFAYFGFPPIYITKKDLKL